ncbi:hypothetical protein B0H16DRAFT_1685717 [Mycena metata]|uniref:Uncharacterized protein n=1 Tax=Mycena metata TaxID=1033252 RepID=A0AAD7NR88_9AGAR|nr:hypothetical protein B0H16DRAFT_1685717 [Mycena metata]
MPSSPSTSSAPFFPPPYRIPDAPSPTKRQRRSSTPRQPGPSASATPDELYIEREASARRMRDVWDQLAEKYSRRIDEDDIIDLVTGEIVKDRGVLSAETPWKFGRFADESVDDSTGTDEEEDDDIDELDLFAESPQVEIHGWTVPPVRKVDPADAKDLEEFMEAERRRREVGGEEESSEEDTDDVETALDDDNATDPVPAPPAPRRGEIDDSDDELDNWDTIDESNVVSPVKSETIEILDSPSVSPIRSSPRFKVPLPKLSPERRPQPPLQLQTPPRSQTPSVLEDFPTSVPMRPQPSPPSKPLTPKRDDPVKTRSQSRGRSPQRGKTSQERLPRLDLASIKRGRSITRRPTRPIVDDDPEKSKAPSGSTVVAPTSVKRSAPRPKNELSPQPPSAFKNEHGSVPRTPQSTRKRKRKSLSLDPSEPDIPVASSSFVTSSSKGKQRATSVSARVKSEKPADEAGEASSHHYAHPGIPPYYPPPSFYQYPPYPPPSDVHPAMPLQDPRAQFIISQAMHQLSTLFTAPWPAQPYTPHRASSSARAASTSAPSPYYPYPTTPHHTHTHPYVFDSGASVGTLPPSSPPDSSPPSSSPHRPSLVSRSRSRGRRVSFKLDNDPRDGADSSEHETDLPARGRARHRQDEGEPDGR